MGKRADIVIENHGSIFIFRPVTRRARTWVNENVSDDRQEFAGGIVVEHRYIAQLADGAAADGLVVR